MRMSRHLVAVAVLAAAATAGCSRSKGCPAGLNFVSSRSTPGKEIWCVAKDGKRAHWIEFYGKDDRRQSCAYNDGRPEGSFTAWHSGGKPWLEGEYRYGTKAGVWTQWDKNGGKVAQAEYRNGELIAGAPVGIPAACEKQKP